MPEAAFEAGPGDVATRARKRSRQRPDPSARPRAGDPLVTRTTFRLLLQRGLAPAEAADLTAFMCGIPVGEVHWSLQQVNRLLFLRELDRSGRFGPRDGETPRSH